MNEIEPVLAAGANEVYFGIMTREWVDQYGNGDFVSRRQSEMAHFSTCDELSEIAYLANGRHCTATLVLNSRYSRRQLPRIFEILEQWENRGGHSVMVSDIEVLLWLNERRSKLKRQLSVMAGTFNSRSAAFFSQFGVSRIVLPREMSISEMNRIVVNTGKSMEFEAIVMFQKCQYIDSFCNFYHLCNEKHGCQMEFSCGESKITHVDNNDLSTPFCAACSLGKLSDAGIHHFKIAGRGYPAGLIINAIRFTRQILVERTKSSACIKKIYKSLFGNNCHPKNCYYQ